MVSRLFAPPGAPAEGPGGAGPGAAGGSSPRDDGDGKGLRGPVDPAEQAARERLREVVQRIQAGRDRRGTGPAPGKRDPSNLQTVRDW